MQIPTNFLTWGCLGTFTGMAMAVMIIVQFTKGIIKKVWPDQAVRIYAFCWALVFVVVAALSEGAFNVSLQNIAAQALLCIINAIFVTTAAMGAYEVIIDPTAQKQLINKRPS
jgi:hypothetical protein